MKKLNLLFKKKKYEKAKDEYTPPLKLSSPILTNSQRKDICVGNPHMESGGNAKLQKDMSLQNTDITKGMYMKDKYLHICI